MNPLDLELRFAAPQRLRVGGGRRALVREACLHVAMEVNANCPPGREQALAVTKIEEAMFWALAAIDREQEYAS